MANIVNQISVDELYRRHGRLLGLEWVAGRQGGRRVVVPEIIYPPAPTADDDAAGHDPTRRDPVQHDPTGHDLTARDPTAGEQDATGGRRRRAGKSLVGYLNLIHPHQVQLLGQVELDFIDKLRETTLADTLGEVYSHDPVCMIITDACQAPAILIRRCNEAKVPLFKTRTVSARVSDTLHYFLTNMFAEVITLHGVFMEVMGIGVLISGPSVIGKSELALELITRGHRLIADDAPEFAKVAPDTICGSCPDALLDFLEVRGLGIINVRKLYGDNAVKKEKYLHLITRLARLQKAELNTLDRLAGSYRDVRIFDLDVPEITLPVAPGRNMAILVEGAVRNHVLRMGGYDSSKDFAERQRRLVENNRAR